MGFPYEAWEWVKQIERNAIIATRSAGKSRQYSNGDFKRLDSCPISGRDKDP
tara:strand:- start:129 stop:284 length:156 start_codon:yes stop_codon:yes gene_type:complete